jgi:hypothetical protein
MSYPPQPPLHHYLHNKCLTLVQLPPHLCSDVALLTITDFPPHPAGRFEGPSDAVLLAVAVLSFFCFSFVFFFVHTALNIEHMRQSDLLLRQLLTVKSLLQVTAPTTPRQKTSLMSVAPTKFPMAL